MKPQIIDRSVLFPQSTELEKSVLGAIIVENAKPLADIPFITSETFYSTAHSYIWDAIRYLYMRGDNVDLLTVIQRLDDSKQLESVGGSIYLAG